MEQQIGQQKIPLGKWILLFISGLLIGGGAILPGISGGVLCVVFGIYRPMMELLSHPGKAVPKYWRIFIPVGLGWIAGFLGFARVIDVVFSANKLLATWLFIGLIAGTIPALFKEAGLQGRPRGVYTVLIIAFVALMGILLAVRFSPAVEVEPSFFWYVFCGILWGLSLIVPGMSSSSILMSLGLYQPLAGGIANLDPSVLIPWIVGMAITVVALAKVINHLFEKRYAYAYHGVVGVVLASTLAIIPLEYNGVATVIWSLVSFAGGFAAAWFLARLDRRGESGQGGE
jgi:putative membrane protein